MESLSLGLPGYERSDAIDRIHAATAIYTSMHVVRGLLKRVGWPAPGATLFDPAAGDGAFLVGAIEALNPDRDDTDAVSRILGWEFHPGAVADARDRVASCLTERGWSQWAANEAAARMVVEADFLTDELPVQHFDFIAANPPYLRYGHLPEYAQALYSRHVASYAKADLMHAFLDRCSQIMNPAGVVAMVTADRWLFNASAAELREKLGGRLGIVHLARLDSTTSFCRPKRRVAGSPPRIHAVELVMRVPALSPRAITRDAISPDGNEAVVGATRTLSDIATVRIAPWLGPAGMFDIRGRMAERLKTRGVEMLPAVDTDDIDPASDRILEPTRFVPRTNRDIRPRGLLLWHLRRFRNRLPKRAEGRPFWLPMEAITLPLDQPMLMIPRIARSLRAIPLPHGVLPINHNLAVVVSNGGHSLDAVRTILNSEESQTWIRANAPRLENGYFSILTTLLRRLPIPDSALPCPANAQPFTSRSN